MTKFQRVKVAGVFVGYLSYDSGMWSFWRKVTETPPGFELVNQAETREEAITLDDITLNERTS